MKLFQRLKKWINGFRKIEYRVDLQTKFDPNKLDRSIIDSILQFMIRSLDNLSLKNFSFGIRDFLALKVEDNKSRAIILETRKCISNMKITRIQNGDSEELLALITLITIGIDDCLWELNYKVGIEYNGTYNEKILEYLIDYTNGIIECMGTNAMSSVPLEISKRDYISSSIEKYTTTVRYLSTIPEKVGEIVHMSMMPEGFDSLDNMIATTEAMKNMDFCRYEILQKEKEE